MQKLNIVASDAAQRNSNGRLSRRKEAEARFDRLWLVNPGQMNPLRNIRERERIARTLELLQDRDLTGKRILDLGCGGGVLSRQLRDRGAEVDAVDISSNALKILSEQSLDGIRPMQDYAPATKLPDDTYDIILCSELIAYLPKEERRMLFSELARLVNPDGRVVCSSALDINSLDALQQFADLAETELKIERWVFSYHLCWIRLKDFFIAPARFTRAWKDPEYKRQALDKRSGISRWWFQLNSHAFPGILWSVIQIPCSPIVTFLKTNRSLLIALEKFCRLFWSESGISHALFIGQRKPLYVPPPENEIPREAKHKKQVWE